MCGRYSSATPPADLARRFRTELPRTNLEPRYNIAPTQSAPIVREAGGARDLALVRWGLVPAWAKDLAIGARLINARSETVADKPAFRAAFRARRCLVVADGFYEWRKDGARKLPWRFVRADGQPFAMAGLWESWGPEKLETFAILTTAANAVVAPVHDRMPAIFADAAAEDAWLAAADAAPLRPAPDDLLRAYRVGDRLNSPRHDDVELLAEMTENSL